MPAQKRFKTDYPGVFYIEGQRADTGKPELIYYISYRKDGRKIEEKAGKQFQNKMTPAKAANLRALRITGNEPTNKERRKAAAEVKEAKANTWTIARLWDEYKALKPQKKASAKALKKGISEEPDYGTYAADKSRYENFLKETFSSKEPKALVPLDIDRLRVKLLKTMKPQTVKHVLALLRRIIQFGVNKGLCFGPKFKIEMPKVDNVKTETLTPEQIKKLIEVCKQADHKEAGGFVLLALYTGMRRGELFRLQWPDIDFDNGFITIREPKGGKTEKIPLNDLARELLKKHPRTDSLFVFPGKGGEQRTDIKKALETIRTDAELPPGFRPLHGLRHTFASMLASSGKVDLYTLQKLLTHKSPAMTQRYAHLRDETLKQAANVAGAMIDSAINKKGDNVVEIGKPTA